MKITLLSDESIRLEATAGPLTVEAPSPDATYSPFHMLASGLAACTYSVLHSWATHADLDAAALSIDVAWSFAEKPHRVGELRMTLRWPGLPEQRVAAAQRAAALCPIHATFHHLPSVLTEVAR
jgi:uncharacterized OsmC-like protein